VAERKPLLHVFFASSLCLTALAHADPAVISFDVDGGEAWTFSLPVSGHASPKCHAVTVQSPLATVNAIRIGERFFADVPLLSGDNPLRAICQAAHGEVVRSLPQVWRVVLPDNPTAWIRLTRDADILHLDAGRTSPAPTRSTPVVAYEWTARASNPAPLQLAAGATLDPTKATLGERIEVVPPQRDGEYYVDLRVTDALGRTDRAAAVFRVAAGRPQIVDVATEHPHWVDTAVLYGAAAYNFEPQNFRGIQERLDEIAALGATVVWLSPVTQAAPDDFGYAVTDQFAFRAQFGTGEQFRTLVDTAHRLGLRVIVDFVPNHFSDQHRYYRDVLARGVRSPYYDWFERDNTGAVTHYFDWTHLLNLDYDNPEVRDYITAALARFVRDYDVDGFRVDASWAVAQRAPEFWPGVRAELKRIDPDIFLLAEASAREPYYVANGFDAAYDWTQELGVWAWRDVFGEDGSVDLSRLRAALTNDGNGFPPDSLILRFINNNDTGERFIARHGRASAMLAATLEFTLPGIPLIYNGDEVGASFDPYDEGPPLHWHDEDALTRHYRKLAALKKGLTALQSRQLTLLHTDHDQQAMTYVRPGRTPGDDLLVLLNFSERELRLRPQGDQTAAAMSRFSRSRDQLSGAACRFDPARPAVRIASKSALVLRAE
jgi:cyclomaltodextrinase / maltogenic alpha-amylase / neopullulanase